MSLIVNLYNRIIAGRRDQDAQLAATYLDSDRARFPPGVSTDAMRTQLVHGALYVCTFFGLPADNQQLRLDLYAAFTHSSVLDTMDRREPFSYSYDLAISGRLIVRGIVMLRVRQPGMLAKDYTAIEQSLKAAFLEAGSRRLHLVDFMVRSAGVPDTWRQSPALHDQLFAAVASVVVIHGGFDAFSEFIRASTDLDGRWI